MSLEKIAKNIFKRKVGLLTGAVIGGGVGAVVGSVFGPAGTAGGAALGKFLGGKIGFLASGGSPIAIVTAGLVDCVDSIGDVFHAAPSSDDLSSTFTHAADTIIPDAADVDFDPASHIQDAANAAVNAADSVGDSIAAPDVLAAATTAASGGGIVRHNGVFYTPAPAPDIDVSNAAHNAANADFLEKLHDGHEIQHDPALTIHTADGKEILPDGSVIDPQKIDAQSRDIARRLQKSGFASANLGLPGDPFGDAPDASVSFASASTASPDPIQPDITKNFPKETHFETRNGGGGTMGGVGIGLD